MWSYKTNTVVLILDTMFGKGINWQDTGNVYTEIKKIYAF